MSKQILSNADSAFLSQPTDSRDHPSEEPALRGMQGSSQKSIANRTLRAVIEGIGRQGGVASSRLDRQDIDHEGPPYPGPVDLDACRIPALRAEALSKSLRSHVAGLDVQHD
jgi:hypothetical protein